MKPLAAALLSLSLVACSVTPDTPSGPRLETYEHDQLGAVAAAQLDALGVTPVQREKALAAMAGLLAHEDAGLRIRARGVSAVVAFRIGSGGLVVGGASGEGRASYAGGPEGERISVDGWSFGAQVGGGESIGVILVLGLEYAARLTDVYAMELVGGSFGAQGHVAAVGRPDGQPHELRIVGTGSGAGGAATLGQLRLVRRR